MRALLTTQGGRPRCLAPVDRIHTATMRIKRELATERGLFEGQVGVFINPARPETASVYISRDAKWFMASGVTS